MAISTFCAKCQSLIDEGRHFCQRCGHPTGLPAPPTYQPDKSPIGYIEKGQKPAGGDRYPALRLGSAIYATLGWIVAIVGGLSGVILLIVGAAGQTYWIAVGVGDLIAAFVTALGLFMVAECLRVVVDIERNTRTR